MAVVMASLRCMGLASLGPRSKRLVNGPARRRPPRKKEKKKFLLKKRKEEGEAGGVTGVSDLTRRLERTVV